MPCAASCTVVVTFSAPAQGDRKTSSARMGGSKDRGVDGGDASERRKALARSLPIMHLEAQNVAYVSKCHAACLPRLSSFARVGGCARGQSGGEDGD